ncbi:MAG: hypothetical protein D6679_14530 [Candidatus Hydrogenedentota bacterium]|nr:MAG: hypothetical protein D6679_14530 [Candidatus Hydrogenedentota bacterium]
MEKRKKGKWQKAKGKSEENKGGGDSPENSLLPLPPFFQFSVFSVSAVNPRWEVPWGLACMKPVLQKVFYLVLAVLLPSSTVLAAADRWVSGPRKRFILERERLSDGEISRVERGSFSVEPRLSYTRDFRRKSRVVSRIGLRWKGFFAERYTLRPKTIFWNVRRKQVPEMMGKTKIRWSAVEVRVGKRPVYYQEWSGLSLEAGDSLIRLQLPVPRADWRRLFIRFLLEVSLLDDEGRLLPDGTKTRILEWKPNSSYWNVSRQRHLTRPPQPGHRSLVGNRILLTPPHPELGETFTATAFLENEETETAPADTGRWWYGSREIRVSLPSLGPGMQSRVSVSFKAEAETRTLRFRCSDFEKSTFVSARTSPQLSLRRLTVRTATTEEPVEVLITVSNTGSAASETSSGVLHLEGGGFEKTILLPPVFPQETTVVSIPWFPGEVETGVAVLESGRGPFVPGGFALLRAGFHRHPPDREDLRITEASLSNTDLPGAPASLKAIIENDGNAETDAVVTIRLLDGSTGDTFLDKRLTVTVKPGKAVSVTSPYFPLAPGIMEGRISAGDQRRSFYIDVPPPHLSEPGEIRFEALSREGKSVPRGVEITERKKVFRFILPLDTEARRELGRILELRFMKRTWPRDPRKLVPQKREKNKTALMLDLRGNQYRDRRTVSAGDTVVQCPVPLERLGETLEVRLVSAGSLRTFLVGEPVLVGRLRAREHGIVNFVERRNKGVVVGLGNRSRLRPIPVVTLAIGLGNEPEKTRVVALQPGKETAVFFPLREEAWKKWTLVTVRLPESVESGPWYRLFPPRAQTPPEWNTRIHPAEIRPRGERALLIEAGIRRADAVGVRFARKSDFVDPAFSLSLQRPQITAELRKRYPRGETLVFLLPSDSPLLLLERDTVVGVIKSVGEKEAEREEGGKRFAQREPGRWEILDLGGDTPAPGHPILIRCRRVAGDSPLPRTTLWAAVNNLLRMRVRCPALEPHTTYTWGIPYRVPPSETFSVILFERTDSAGKVFVAEQREWAVRPDAPPGRAEWKWTVPIKVGPSPSAPPSIFEQLARDAWRVTTYLARHGKKKVVLTPRLAREAGMLDGDTDIEARAEFRKRVSELARQWENALVILLEERLPITVEKEDILELKSATENFGEVVASPFSVPKDIRNAARRLSEAIDHVIPRGWRS